MTSGRRIFLNVAATYARSVYVLVLGLLTARWLLLSLGATDYGIFGLVGGLVAFLTFVNQLLSSAVSRFYAFAYGEAASDARRGLEECRRWFTAAVAVHTVLPLAVFAVGYPLGVLFVRHGLVIPPERLEAAVWVWRLTCVSSFVALVNVPFRAMYTARQEIAEVTVYGVLEATLNAVLLGYMAFHPGDWLVDYAFYHCLICGLLRVAICIGALVRYPECRLVRQGLADGSYVRRLVGFAGWNAVSAFGKVVRIQGMAIVVNLFLGPAWNATLTVASRVSSRAAVFSSSLVGAFSPPIITAYGAKDEAGGRLLSRRVDRLAVLIVGAVVVPFALEMEPVMRLWLKSPPEGTPLLCVCVLAAVLLDKATIGEHISIVAVGRIAGYQLTNGVLCSISLLLAIALMANGAGIAAAGVAVIFHYCLTVVVRLAFARRHVGLRLRDWMGKIAVPVTAAVILSAAVGCVPRLLWEEGLLRILMTLACVEAMLVPTAWRWVLTADERQCVRDGWCRLGRKAFGPRGGAHV